MTQITVRQFLDNVAKNGLPKAKGALFRDNRFNNNTLITANVRRPDILNEYKSQEEKIGAACAMGQGLINSGVLCPSFDDTGMLEDYETSDTFETMYNIVAAINDDPIYDNLDMWDIAEQAEANIISSFGEELGNKFLDKIMNLPDYDYTGLLPDTYSPVEV